MTETEWYEAIAAWAGVFAGGISIGFGVSAAMWIGASFGRMVTEFFRSR